MLQEVDTSYLLVKRIWGKNAHNHLHEQKEPTPTCNSCKTVTYTQVGITIKASQTKYC